MFLEIIFKNIKTLLNWTNSRIVHFPPLFSHSSSFRPIHTCSPCYVMVSRVQISAGEGEGKEQDVDDKTEGRELRGYCLEDRYKYFYEDYYQLP